MAAVSTYDYAYGKAEKGERRIHLRLGSRRYNEDNYIKYFIYLTG